ncbi:hypothetical protein BN946_scf184881.g10 [Trametes cinnabarina]|uniref:SUN domain-containing protein n=1 Tax=Pycnoporus cinnabarinus TaxID=5643 RepID=A0A060STK2_PYCCI|nr:hypothetical protein BN946_scf184881.g10 [Trametes cinnabarina]
MAGPFDPERWVYESPSGNLLEPRSRTKSQNRRRTIPATANPQDDGSPNRSSRNTLATSSIGPSFISSLCGVIAAVAICVCIQRFLQVPSSTSSTVTNGLDIEPHVKAYVENAIARALRDPVGLRDYALFADGARVISELTTPAGDRDVGRFPRPHSPEIALVDDIRIGSCWFFSGDQAQLGLQLSNIIYPTYVTIDHIPAEIAADAGASPHKMILWGAVDGSANERRLGHLSHDPTFSPSLGRVAPTITHGYRYVALASFEYDIWASSHVQTFSVYPHIRSAKLDFGVMVLEILGNWGANGTCLYRPAAADLDGQVPGPTQSVLKQKRRINGKFAHTIENVKSMRTGEQDANAPPLELSPEYDKSLRNRWRRTTKAQAPSTSSADNPSNMSSGSIPGQSSADGPMPPKNGESTAPTAHTTRFGARPLPKRPFPHVPKLAATGMRESTPAPLASTSLVPTGPGPLSSTPSPANPSALASVAPVTSTPLLGPTLSQATPDIPSAILTAMPRQSPSHTPTTTPSASRYVSYASTLSTPTHVPGQLALHTPATYPSTSPPYSAQAAPVAASATDDNVSMEDSPALPSANLASTATQAARNMTRYSTQPAYPFLIRQESAATPSAGAQAAVTFVPRALTPAPLADVALPPLASTSFNVETRHTFPLDDPMLPIPADRIIGGTASTEISPPMMASPSAMGGNPPVASLAIDSDDPMEYMQAAVDASPSSTMTGVEQSHPAHAFNTKGLLQAVCEMYMVNVKPNVVLTETEAAFWWTQLNEAERRETLAHYSRVQAQRLVAAQESSFASMSTAHLQAMRQSSISQGGPPMAHQPQSQGAQPPTQCLPSKDFTASQQPCAPSFPDNRMVLQPQPTIVAQPGTVSVQDQGAAAVHPPSWGALPVAASPEQMSPPSPVLPYDNIDIEIDAALQEVSSSTEGKGKARDLQMPTAMPVDAVPSPHDYDIPECTPPVPRPFAEEHPQYPGKSRSPEQGSVNVDMMLLFLQKLDSHAEVMQKQAQFAHSLMNELQGLRTEFTDFKEFQTSLRSEDAGPGPRRRSPPLSAREKKLTNPSLRVRRRAKKTREKAARQAGTTVAALPNNDGDADDEDTMDVDEGLDDDAHMRRLKARVRNLLESMLDIPDWSKAESLYPTLTQEEVTQYLERTGEFVCTEDNFYVDFERSWKKFALNKEARQVFIDKYLKSVAGGAYLSNPTPPHLLTPETIGEVLDNHMTYCRQRWRRSVKPLDGDVAEQRAKRSAQRSRQRTLHESRIVTLRRHGHRRHLRLFALLEPVHMSGDETDGPEKKHPSVFRITIARWQSEAFRNFLWAIDAQYRADWEHPRERRRTPGNEPRVRVLPAGGTDSATECVAPIGLPRNCYDEGWLASLSAPTVRELDIQEVVYDFSL